MDIMLFSVLSLIALALVFDFINGFHDAANSVSTIIGTETLSPKVAILLAAFFNIVGLFVFQLHIAAAIGKGMVDPSIIDFYVVASALLGAIVWNLITWWLGLPSSSSHALIGGVVGAAVAKGGTSILITAGLTKIAAFIVLSPIIGMILAFLVFKLLVFIVPNIKAKDQIYRWGQIVSSSLYSIGHGSNDAQKTAGIIFLILIAGGFLTKDDSVPYWVALLSFLFMGLGTLAGGWKIIKTMAYDITDLKPRSGFAAEMAGSVMLFSSASLGVPVSTTHVITGAIVGVGGADKGKLNWKLLRTIVTGWILTIPAVALIASSLYVFLHLILS